MQRLSWTHGPLSLICFPSDSVANLSGSPVKEGVFTMDPMLEHALDFDTDEDEEHGNRD